MHGLVGVHGVVAPSGRGAGWAGPAGHGPRSLGAPVTYWPATYPDRALNQVTPSTLVSQLRSSDVPFGNTVSTGASTPGASCTRRPNPLVDTRAPGGCDPAAGWAGPAGHGPRSLGAPVTYWPATYPDRAFNQVTPSTLVSQLRSSDVPFGNTLSTGASTPGASCTRRPNPLVDTRAPVDCDPAAGCAGPAGQGTRSLGAPVTYWPATYPDRAFNQATPSTLVSQLRSSDVPFGNTVSTGASTPGASCTRRPNPLVDTRAPAPGTGWLVLSGGVCPTRAASQGVGLMLSW